MKVGILDYEVGNIKSVYNAVRHVNSEPVLISSPKQIKKFSHIIAPGVGNFGYVVEKFIQHEFYDAVKNYINEGGYYLGICVGMQMLFDGSVESPGVTGLGMIPGNVVKMSNQKIRQEDKKIKLPHIGWSKLNLVNEQKNSEKFLSGVPIETPFYFVHSYTAKPSDERYLVATTDYGSNTVSALVCKDNTFGTQFHPERSGEAGLKLINNFCNLS